MQELLGCMVLFFFLFLKFVYKPNSEKEKFHKIYKELLSYLEKN